MSVGREIPAVKVDVTIPQLWNEFLLLSEYYEGFKMAQIELLLAHVAVEVGLDADGSYTDCYCYAIGNKRPRKTPKGVYVDDYCLYPCGEELPQSDCKKLVESPYVQIVAKYNRVTKNDKGQVTSSVPYYSLKFVPPHPYTRFRAFKTLAEAAKAQLDHIYARPKSKEGLISADPAKYAKALFADKYYTANSGVYTAALIYRLKQATKITQSAEYAHYWQDFV